VRGLSSEPALIIFTKLVDLTTGSEVGYPTHKKYNKIKYINLFKEKTIFKKMKKENKIKNFFIYMINELNIPVLQHRKIPNIISPGDRLNIIAQPLSFHLKSLEEKIETEEQLNNFLEFKEKIEKLFSLNKFEYSFYELLEKGYLGIINSNQKVEFNHKYHASIKKLDYSSVIPIVIADILSYLETGNHINYKKSIKNNKNSDLISTCEALTEDGENIIYKVGKTNVLSFGGVKKLGDLYVSFFTKQKTKDGKDVHLKVVYKNLPKKEFLKNLEIKINRIIVKPDKIEIKAYPLFDNIY